MPAPSPARRSRTAAGPARRATAATRPRAAASRRRRPPRRRIGPGMLAALVTSVAILGGTVFVLNRPDALPGGDRTAQARVAQPGGATTPPPATATPSATPPPPPPAAPAPAPTPASAAPTSAPPSATPSPGGAEGAPVKGAGTFTVAPGSADPVGKGRIRRYRVEVEDGIGIDPAASAQQIQGILADRRGWTNDRKNGFQRVADGAYDFTVKIASPATVDRICGAAGLDTHGEVNCNVGSQVLVNVKRWTTGSPQFDGPIDEYRALVINHEVGHRIGHGHETCPGPGKPAPAMMQQIYGLKGCAPNAWPYGTDGGYLSGPAVP
ncbi:DUF3152 domain-containing protein [Kitasatospora sp. NPDC058115]|uniref:DUF3152 domain-containing protein n=1 Tax=Kitasatospora sp. NPDC058115 TaxID=3346347 RepID=UPI0036D8FA18